MIAPQMPTGLLIWQPIFHHQAHGQANDAMSVVDFGQSILRGVGSKILITLGTVMLRVGKVDVTRSVRNQISDVMQNSGDDVVSSTTTVTIWTWVMLVVAAT